MIKKSDPANAVTGNYDWYKEEAVVSDAPNGKEKVTVYKKETINEERLIQQKSSLEAQLAEVNEKLAAIQQFKEKL